jgi:hypothetical protein
MLKGLGRQQDQSHRRGHDESAYADSLAIQARRTAAMRSRLDEARQIDGFNRAGLLKALQEFLCRMWLEPRIAAEPLESNRPESHATEGAQQVDGLLAILELGPRTQAVGETVWVRQGVQRGQPEGNGNSYLRGYQRPDNSILMRIIDSAASESRGPAQTDSSALAHTCQP